MDSLSLSSNYCISSKAGWFERKSAWTMGVSHYRNLSAVLKMPKYLCSLFWHNCFCPMSEWIEYCFAKAANLTVPLSVVADSRKGFVKYCLVVIWCYSIYPRNKLYFTWGWSVVLCQLPRAKKTRFWSWQYYWLPYSFLGVPYLCGILFQRICLDNHILQACLNWVVFSTFVHSRASCPFQIIRVPLKHWIV